jgi:transcriptional regulator with XRE-family HTH domain
MGIFELMEKIRLDLVLDIKQFSKKLGISRSAYYNYKNDKRNPSFYVRKRLFEIARENNNYSNTKDFFE